MEKFVITIARGYGSGGRTIGQMLSKELGVGYYDKEILRLASDESGINESLFALSDEKLKAGILEKVTHEVYTGEIIPPEKPDFTSEKNLFNYQAKILKELAARESCVIIGRCADFILRDMKNLIRVYVHAPMEYCIQNLEELLNETPKEIEKIVLKTDKQRAEYYKHYTGNDWKNADNYDLCLNSQELGFDKCVDIIKAYLNIRFS